MRGRRASGKVWKLRVGALVDPVGIGGDDAVAVGGGGVEAVDEVAHRVVGVVVADQPVGIGGSERDIGAGEAVAVGGKLGFGEVLEAVGGRGVVGVNHRASVASVSLTSCAKVSLTIGPPVAKPRVLGRGLVPPANSARRRKRYSAALG